MSTSDQTYESSEAPFCPSIYSYAAVRMDPVAMVEHLNDAEALASAEALRPKTYVVYIDCDHSLPWPGVPWYGFNVRLVAPSRPPADEEQGFSPDMCTPIFPNATPVHDRAPLVLQPPESFPYTNCYHWPDMGLDIRVLARPEGFDHSRVAKLPAREVLRLSRCVVGDSADRAEALKARRVAMGLPPLTPTDEYPEDASPLPGCNFECNSTHDHDAPDEDDTRSFQTFSSDYSHSASGSVDMMDGFFGDPEHDIEVMPLVHLWVDMAAHLKQEDIADPREFFAERDAIVSIIKAARARNPSLPPMLPPVPAIFQEIEGKEDAVDKDAADTRSNLSNDSSDSSESDGIASDVDHVGLMKSRQLWPSKLLRNVGISMRQVFRLPYIPVWP